MNAAPRLLVKTNLNSERNQQMLLATPDFGASGVIVVFLLVGWAVLFALVAVGIFFGTRLRKSGSASVRAFGFAVIMASCLFPVFCYAAPPYVVRLAYGNYPLGSYPSGKIEDGMSVDEVVAILGTPHEVFPRWNGNTYHYYIDSFDIHYFQVDFGPDKRVTHTSGN